MDIDGLHGLSDLNDYFIKRKKEIQVKVDETTRRCQSYRTTITDLEYQQIYLEKQIVSDAGTDRGKIALSHSAE